ncbi:MAG: IS200/IS605 family transposase [Candidatus Aenigmarchaeota archaeon]|nr:IS200/IS605 family transposase [Candidatus Aenigmarchaeota archaeon]
MEIRHASQCTYRIRYHMVFVIKFRKNLLTDKIFEFMKIICKGIEERYNLYFDALGADGNHLHIVVEGAPRYSPSRIMQICKSILAIQIFKKFPKLKEELWGGKFWSAGGHIDSVGDGRGLEEVKKYVKKQGNKAQLKLYEFH